VNFTFRSQRVGLPVLLDAEPRQRPPAIDYCGRERERAFNPAGVPPTVYNTYQMYMTCAERRVARDLRTAEAEGFVFAAKV
jgi:hypothetical protein